MKYRVYNPRYNDFKYWGFMDGIFNGPPTGSGLTIDYCRRFSELCCGFDVNGREYFINDICKDEHGNLFLVVWENNCVTFAYEVYRKPSYLLEYFEVVSNIHQDVDLLSGNLKNLQIYELAIRDRLTI